MQRFFGLGLLVVGFLGGFFAMRDPAVVAAPASHVRSTPARDHQAIIALPAVDERIVEAMRAPPPPRRYRPGDAALTALARAEERLQATGVPIDNPCRDVGKVPCAARPLDAWFARLDALADGSATKHATAIAVGNSLIAADGIVDVVRARLQEQFHDGGRGLLLAERISEHGVRRRTGTGSGLHPYYLSQGPSGPVPFGLSGVAHVAQSDAATTRFSLAGERRASVWLASEGRATSALEVRADGEPVPLAGSRAGGVFDYLLPEGATRLELLAKERGLAIQGVVLEHERPGVVLDTVGLPAADSPRWLAADEALVKDQLRARDPSLVVVMLGGVENRRIAWGTYSDDDIARDLRALIARLKAGAPDASCLVVGPIDAVEGVLDERVLGRAVRPFSERPELRRVIALERRVALQSGCAFYDLFAAMGGSGALKRLARYGWLHDDHVHPRGFGLDYLGELIADAMLEEWRRTASFVPRARLARLLRDDARAPTASSPGLAEGARSLKSLVRGERSRLTFGIVDEGGELTSRLQSALASVAGPPAVGLDAYGRLLAQGLLVGDARASDPYDVVIVAGEAPPPRNGDELTLRLASVTDDAGEALVTSLLELW